MEDNDKAVDNNKDDNDGKGISALGLDRVMGCREDIKGINIDGDNL